MKRFFLFLAVSIFTVNAYTQNSTQNSYQEWKPSQDEYKDFDIGKYKTPDIVRNQMDITFDFNSYHSNSESTYTNWDSRNESSIINGNISAIFSHYVNTRKKISNFASYLSIEENSRKDKQTYTYNQLPNIDRTSSFSQQNSLTLVWLEKRYFSNLFFINYSINGNISYNFNRNKTENVLEDTDQKQKKFFFHISPQAGTGYGRIENVRDARHTVYIANALTKNGVLTRRLSDEEMMEMSQIISTVKNKRFLDSRQHFIEEITSLDTFFADHDLLADNGAAYFTTLYDMWQYGDLFSRRSGYEISFAIHPSFSHQKVKYTPIIQEMIYQSNQYLMSLSFDYEKPFQLKWQHSLSTEVFGGIYSSSTEEKQNNFKNTETDKNNMFSALAYYALGYYPNTRTNIQITTSQQMLKYINEDDTNSTIFQSMLGANLFYYFSPNLRLSCDFDLVYSPRRYRGNENYYSDRNYFSSLFNIQMTYLIF